MPQSSAANPDLDQVRYSDSLRAALYLGGSANRSRVRELSHEEKAKEAYRSCPAWTSSSSTADIEGSGRLAGKKG